MRKITIENKNYEVPQSIVSVKVVSGSSEIDGDYYQTKFEIKTDSGTDTCTVNVHLCGDDYQPQNGCYLDGRYTVNGDAGDYCWNGDEFINPFEYDSNDSDAYTKEVEEMEVFVETLKSIAIRLSEKQAGIDLHDRIDEESETEEGETWTHFKTLESCYHSATSRIETLVEESGMGRFRIVKKMDGFVQPNDYACVPEPELIAFFANEDEFKEVLSRPALPRWYPWRLLFIS